MQIGDTLALGGRRYAVRGFDPEGVSPRMIYLEDVAKGTHRIVPFERLRTTSRRGVARLRLVDTPSVEAAGTRTAMEASFARTDN